MEIGTRGRRRRALVGLLLVPVLGACSSTGAVPGAPPPSPSAAPHVASATITSTVEERLDDLVVQVTGDHDDTDVPGYAGLSVDAAHAALDVWWVGDPPERVRRLVAAPPDGLTVVLHPARYDVAAMVHAVDALMDRYPVLHAASPESDGSGIEVESTKKGVRSLPSAARLAEEAGMPVRVVVSRPVVPA